MATLLQFVLCAFCSLASFLSAVVFRGAAAAAAALLSLVRIHGEACNDAVELARGVVGSVLRHVLEFVADAAVFVVSSLAETVWSGVVGLLQLTATGVAELVEMSRSALQGAAETILQMVAGLAEVVVKVVGSVWSNYRDAVGYAMKKA